MVSEPAVIIITEKFVEHNDPCAVYDRRSKTKIIRPF